MPRRPRFLRITAIVLLAFTPAVEGGPAAAADLSAVSVTLASPPEGAIIFGTVNLTGEARAATPVSEVQYAVTPRGEDPTGWQVMPASSLSMVGGDPSRIRFSHPFASRRVANGELTILVRAIDASVPQQVSLADGANVTIVNTPPLVTLDPPGAPDGSRILVTGSVEAETTARIDSILLVVLGPGASSAAADLDRDTGKFSASLDLTGLADGAHEVVAQVTYDGGVRVASAPARIDVRKPWSLGSMMIVAFVLVLAALAATLVVLRLVENQRLRSAGVDPRRVIREPIPTRLRAAASRNPPFYGLGKEESASGAESVHTLDAVRIGRATGVSPDRKTIIVGKVTWRRSGAAARVTVFELDGAQTGEGKGVRLIALAKRKMALDGLHELTFEVRPGAEAARTTELLRQAGAVAGNEENRGAGRVTTFVLRR